MGQVTGESNPYFCHRRDIVVLVIQPDTMFYLRITATISALKASGFGSARSQLKIKDAIIHVENKTITLTHPYDRGTVCKTINDLTYALHLRYDYSLALRSNVARSLSEELGEMAIQDLSKRAKIFKYA